MRSRFLRGVALLMALVFAVTAASSAQQGTVSVGRSGASALEATSEILQSVSRIRALDIKRPVKSGLKTQDEIEQAVIRDLNENNTDAEFEATTKALVKFGMVPRDFRLREFMVKLLREQVAGFYEPRTQEFYLAAWIPLADQKPVIAHELTHALQDQHFNLRRLEKWPRGDSDAELAARALVEGDATVVMLQYAAAQNGLNLDVGRVGPLTDLLLDQSGDDNDARYPVLSSAPRALRESLQFPYAYGAGFVQSVMRGRNLQAVNDAYRHLPSSTEQILHPERFLARDNPVRVELADLLPALAGWKKLDDDVNGEFGYRLLVSEFVEQRRSNLAAEGWGGDRYALYEDPRSGALLLAQFTTWDSNADAREFFDIYSERIQKRYGVGRPADLEARSRVYETKEGLVAIEMRDRDVIVIEGATNAAQLRGLTERLWRSRKI